jgi:hypothetical protein
MEVEIHAKVVYDVATRWNRSRVEGFWDGSYKLVQQPAIQASVEALGGTVLGHIFKCGPTKITETDEIYDGATVWECYPKVVTTVSLPDTTTKSEIAALTQEVSDSSEQVLANVVSPQITLVRTHRKQYS